MAATWTAPEPFPHLMLGAPFVAMQPEPTAGLRCSLFERAAPEAGLSTAMTAIEGGANPVLALVEFLLDLGEQTSLFAGPMPSGPDTEAQAMGPIFTPEAFDENLGGRNSQKAAISAALSARTNAEVAIGCIDTSIAFVNARFRQKDPNHGPDKTRFELLWIQGRAAKAPAPYASILRAGTLLLRRDIDALIAKHWHNGQLDEAGVYAEFIAPPTGYADLWMLREGHGTTVLDLMTGAPTKDASDAQPIYGVELPVSVVSDTSGSVFHGPLTFGLGVIAMASYALSRTTTNAPAPLVANASLGFLGGPHDGTHPTAATLQAVMTLAAGPTRQTRQAELTLPAGNHLQSRTHARAIPQNAHQFAWSLPPEDRTASFVEIWNSTDQPPVIDAITLIPPGDTGGTTTALPAIHQRILLETNGRQVAHLYNRGTHLIIGIYPTSDWTPGAPHAPSGLWTLIAKGPTTAPHLFWVARDDTLTGLKSAGRQSWLRDPGYVARDGYGDFKTQSDIAPEGGRRDGTLSVIATAGAPVTVISGRENYGGKPYRFAGLPLNQATPPAPAAFAPAAEVSRALGGPMSATRKGSATTRLAGTSMASAIQARHIVDQIQGTTCSPLGYREITAYRF